MEQWKWINGFEGDYMVSSQGRIKSFKGKTERLMSLCPNSDGYLTTSLRKNGKGVSIKVHKVVAETFIPNPQNKETINHIDENKTNNRVENLEWNSRKENVNHGTRTERASKTASRSVIQYSKDGIQLNIFSSIKEASEITNTATSGIGAVCRGERKTAGGFMWKYNN